MRGLTPDQVEAALIEEEAVISRARARQMAWVAVADAMQLPTADGTRSMREWLAGRLDIDARSARRLTTTARRLSDSADIADQLAEGNITFDRAEALARIPAAERDDMMPECDIAGVRRHASRLRHLTAVDDAAAHAAQHLVLQPNLDESMWDLWGRLDGHGGAVVNKVLTEQADMLPDLPDGQPVGIGYRRAVALAKICEGDDPADSRTPIITVFVDGNGVEVEGGTAVGAGVLDKIACSGALEVITSAEGEPLGVGRRSRVIGGRLRRFILHRDGGCSADGCTSRYRLEPHHVVPWSEGGPTNPENLLTLCWFHHHVVVHGWGYRIDPGLGRGRIRFRRPGAGPPSHAPPGA